MEDMEDYKDNINIKYEALCYEFNAASGKGSEFEGASVIGILKSELKNDVNIKCESLDCAHDDIDSESVIGCRLSLASEKFINREVEEHQEEEEIDIKYESLNYGLKRPALKSTNKHPKKQFECPKCSYKSKYKSNVNRHIKKTNHEMEKMPRLSCQLCPYETFSMDHLNRHILFKHVENRKQFECHKCIYKSKDKHALTRHILSIHEKETAPHHVCEICSYQSVIKSNVKQHMMRVHQGIHNEFSLECTLCQKSFKAKKSLDSHYVSAHRDQSDSFKHLLTSKVNQCSKCSYITGDATSFKRHLLTHEENQSKFKFVCYTCGYKCMQKSTLVIHVRIHAGTSVLPFACSECNKRFNLKYQLASHIVSQHKDNEKLMKTVTNKIHQCLKCNFKTVKSVVFKKHMKKCCNNK